ncbi:MAG: insulinase family protein [Prevotella sp.]|jgi:predicted Zn-dependent peptidase|nr:insulinase family protein [Prevotella sp.]MCI1281970.1 insulinase family protein [Prevotella sp.]
MRLKLVFASLLLMFGLTALQAKDYKYQTVKGDPMQTRIYTLDNGLKVYLSVNKEKPRIQTFIAVRTGSRNDPAETTGLAHYLEHLMFKGTQKFGTSNYTAEKPLLDEIEQRYEAYRKLTDPAKRKQAYHEIDSVSQVAAKYNIPNEYDKLMASIGSEGSNAFTSNDVTCYVEDIPSNEIENWAKVQSDRFQNMVIRGFHTELEAVYEEYNIGLANDGNKEWDAISKLIFPTHPYGTQTTIGTQEHLKNPSITNIKNYFKRYYVPNNVAIIMAGDFNPDKVIATLDEYFGTWKKSDNLSRPEYPSMKPMTAPSDSTVIGLEAENIIMGWRMPQANSYAADTLTVIADMLANGKAGLFDMHLYQPMKIQSAGAFYEGLHDYGMFLLEGSPKQGQKLEEVRDLMLQEIDKLKRGEFSDDLIPSVVNNFKRNYYQSLQSNRNRASKFMDAFINQQKWEDQVGQLDRMSKMTKAEIVAFANKYLLSNYAIVYKRQGNDSTQKKIDKPAITAIPTNRNMSSQFLKEVSNTKTEPIQPQFVNFKKDLTFGKTGKNVPVIYKHNDYDGLFTLAYYFKFGNEANNLYGFAGGLFDYLGTSKKTANEIKQEFYKIACDYSINVSGHDIVVYLNGLNENMPKAVSLMEDLMKNAKVDQDAWKQFVGLVKKGREDDKKNQQKNFSALRDYGTYGSYNAHRNTLSNEELDKLNPQKLIDLIHGLTNYEHTILYYGPTAEKDIVALMDKSHKTPKNLTPALVNKEYEEDLTPKNEVWLAPYDAKNIYMVMQHNEGRQWNPNEAAVSSLFNEYFGGGMNTVVFQELREARGLAYSAAAYYNDFPPKGHPETALTYIISQNDKMMDCVRVFNEILDTIPQSEGAFQLAKQSLLKQISSNRTTRMGVINAWLSAQRRGIDYDINERIYNALPQVTLQDIVNFEKATMANKPYRYLILGDEKNLNVPALEKIAPIKHVTTEEIFGY